MGSRTKNVCFNNLFVAIGFICVGTTTYANTTPTNDKSGWELNAYVGEAQNTTSNTGSLTFSQYETDTLTDANKDSNDFTPAIGAAYRFVFPKSFLHAVSIGLNYYYTSMSRNGQVYMFGLPQFNNFTYDMDIDSQRLMLDGEFDLRPIMHGITFFGEVGAGGAMNTMSYKEKSVLNNGGQIDLGSNDYLNFSSEIGAGIKVPITQKSIISVRYLYADLGKAESNKQSKTVAMALEKPLTTDLVSQEVLVAYTYRFS